MKKKSIGISVASILATLAVVEGFNFYNDVKNHSSTEDAVIYTQSEVDELVEKAELEGETSILSKIKDSLTAGNSVITTLKALYPDYLVVVSQNLYHWVEIDDSLKMNDYNIDNLEVDSETGEYTYVENGTITSKKGIDVSSHQGSIDWDAVKNDGVEFAFVRACYRGYTTGGLQEDEYASSNIKGAKNAGIDVGVYVFSQAITEEEAIEEAQLVLDILDGTTLELPIVYDVERIVSDSARMNELTVEERTKVTLAFLNTIEDAGYDTMIYHNTEMGALLIDFSQLENYKKWFASYNQEFYWPYDYDVWQYSESGTVDGIDGDVDLDIMFE